MENKTFIEKIKAINETLKRGEPENFSADHKGYTGYKPQYIIDAINTEFCGDWGMQIIDKHTYKSGRTDKNGKEITEAFVHVRVSINGQDVDAVASHPVADDYGDAMKSAQTDAMKKAFAHLSIGNRAYHGLLKK
jgi:hypothetical protein